MTMYKNEMKFHMLLFMNAWMMLVLMKCKCQMKSLTLGCYIERRHVVWAHVAKPPQLFPVSTVTIARSSVSFRCFRAVSTSPLVP